MIALWRGLKKYQVDPVVICPGNGPITALIEDLGLTPHIQDYFHFQPEWRRPLRTMEGVMRQVRFFREKAVSLIHANDPHVARSVMLPAFYLRIPVIVHIRFGQSAEYYRWVFKGLPKPRGFILNSHYLQNEIGPYLHDSCPRVRQWVVHNAVDIEAFTPCYKTANTVPRVGILANLQPVKGHEDFLHMAGMVLERGNSAVFDIIGSELHNSGRMEKLRNMAETMNMSDKITFHGYVADVDKILKKMDIVVSTSHVETFGRSIIEAMAAGKPVVSYAVGGIPEIIVDGQTGFLVPEGDMEKMAERVEFLLGNGAFRQDMGKHGRERVESLFGIDAHADAIMTIYDEFPSAERHA